MTILITGSRMWTNREKIYKRLSKEPPGTTIIEGGAWGADTIAREISNQLGFHVITIPADWKQYGRRAGPIRNRQMLDMQPDLVIAFPVNDSPGTMNCIKQAEKRGIPVELVK